MTKFSVRKIGRKLAALTCAFFLTTSLASAFSDVPTSHENYISIEFLNQTGVVEGYSDGTYKPEQMVNRVEALKIILEGNNVVIQETFGDIPLSDVSPEDWFAKYVMTAKELGIAEGNPDGTFAPARNVVKAEFLKMLLNTNNFTPDKWDGVQMFSDVPADAWFTPYMNYAGQAGLVRKDSMNNLYPGEALNRGDVAEIMYLLNIILNGANTDFLITEANKQMEQIEVYITNNNPSAAKRASELAVDMTQQAYKNLPEDTAVVATAKAARAYDFAVTAYIHSLNQEMAEAQDWAQQAIDKSNEAIELNTVVEETVRLIQNRANAVLAQAAPQV